MLVVLAKINAGIFPDFCLQRSQLYIHGLHFACLVENPLVAGNYTVSENVLEIACVPFRARNAKVGTEINEPEVPRTDPLMPLYVM